MHMIEWQWDTTWINCNTDFWSFDLNVNVLEFWSLCHFICPFHLQLILSSCTNNNARIYNFSWRILEWFFVGSIVKIRIRNECIFCGFMGNELECGTNKSPENRFTVHTICLFCAPIHSPWTQNKRQCTHSLNKPLGRGINISDILLFLDPNVLYNCIILWCQCEINNV